MPRTPKHNPRLVPRSGQRPLIGATLERCIFCAGTDIVKRGRRHKKHETIQRWYCRTCEVSFTPQTAGKGSPFPLKVTLEALCWPGTGAILEIAERDARVLVYRVACMIMQDTLECAAHASGNRTMHGASWLTLQSISKQ